MPKELLVHRSKAAELLQSQVGGLKEEEESAEEGPEGGLQGSEGAPSNPSLSPREDLHQPLAPTALAAAYAARLHSEADYARYKVRLKE